MESPQTLHNLIVDRWPVLSAAAAACLIAFLVPKLLHAVRLAKIPVVGQELGNEEKRRQAYLMGARKLYNDGYEKFKEGVFRITTSRTSPILVLSPIFLNELKRLPDHVVSMSAAVDEAMETKYTKIDAAVPIVPHTVKVALTPALTRLNPLIAEEVKEALSLEISECDDWTEINIHHKLTRIIAMVSGRVFIGPELCRTEQYLDAAINYTLEVMQAQRAVQQMRPWLRPFLAQSLPEVKKLDQRIKEADAFLRPVTELRQKMAADPSSKKPDDMLQWLIGLQPKFPDKSSQKIASVQLGISFAAIHTTTLTATNAFYNIAAMPELVPELRKEIQQALGENNGVFTSKALQSMKKLDSFLKETLRLHPATMASFQRKVLQPFTLSTGQAIPAGVMIEIPTVSINSDADIFPNPLQFDALRFYRLREDARAKQISANNTNDAGDGDATTAALNQFVSVSQNSLTFGYGKHACPGRFFAANELKMILANSLLKYDVKMVEGCVERYPNMEFAHMSLPDPKRSLMFKKRDI